MGQQQKTQDAGVLSSMKFAGLVGAAAFLVGMILSIIGGIWIRDSGTITLILVIGGILVGLLNITAKEVVPFLIATIALIVVGQTGFVSLNDVAVGFGDGLNAIVGYIAAFMAPAAVINAMRAVWALARPG